MTSSDAPHRPSPGRSPERPAEKPAKPLLMVAYHYPPEGGASGVLRALKFSKYLPAAGYVPHVLTLRASSYVTRDEGLLRSIPPEAVVHRTFALDASRHFAIRGRYPGLLAVPDRFVSWLPFGVARGLGVIRRHGIRAIYSTSPIPTAHLIAGCLKRWTGLPWVADFRDPWIEEGIHPRPGSFRERIERPLERWVLRSADRIVATTPRLRAEILGRHPNLPPDRVRVIYNGYDEEDFGVVPTTPNSPRERFEILHAGLVTPDFRDPFPLLRTVAALVEEGSLPRDRTRVTLLGGGPYLESKSFRTELESLRMDDVIEVAGRVAHAEALRRLGESAVLLLLQASEDTRSLIPAKAFEYLRTGRPILALTLEGDTADLMRGMEGCEVVDPANGAALRAAVLRLYENWSRSGGVPSTTRPVDRYERRRLTAQLAEILDEVT